MFEAGDEGEEGNKTRGLQKKKGQIWGLVLMTIERVPHGKSKLFCYWDGASEISISIICIRVYIIIIIIIIMWDKDMDVF